VAAGLSGRMTLSVRQLTGFDRVEAHGMIPALLLRPV
jgi:hypothetical protein